MTHANGVRVVPPSPGLGPATRALLDTLPAWFGIPEANEDYIASAEAGPTWSAVGDEGRVVGVLVERRHNPVSAEIHLLAVHRDQHRLGVGRALVEAFERAALTDGVRLAQVKTLGPSHPDPGYADTRRFYAALGYLPLEELTDLWPGTPALIMVKALADERSGEERAIARVARPITRADLVTGLTAAGLRRGGVAIVHSAISRLGWVVGGEHTVLAALREAIGPSGTLVMPAQTGLIDPSTWANPPVPESWWPTVRDEMPAYGPVARPLRGMGAVVEAFRRLPGTTSSEHPAVAFVANGPLAATIVGEHPLDHALDDRSPLGRLYDLDAQIVLLGVGHGNNTTLHLAEHRSATMRDRTVRRRAPMSVDGTMRWVEYEDLDRDEEDFPAIGEALAGAGLERVATIGEGVVRVLDVRPVVDVATAWIDAHRR